MLAPDRIEAVQTGCCPHTAIRDDITANLDAVELLEERFGPVVLLLTYGSREELLDALLLIDGQLTGSVHAQAEDADLVALLATALGERSGRLIFDGFPRTLAQADALEALMASKGKFLNAVIEMRVDDDVLVDRISGRYTCANCGEGYHDTGKPPVKDGVCDKCGSTEFIRRADDNADAVRVRLMAYYRQTAPLIGYYHAKGKLRTVNGLDDIETISREIKTLLGL